MEWNNNDPTNEIISEVQKIRDELDFIRDRKSRIKLELFYDPENKKLLSELDSLREKHYGLNIRMNELNNKLMEILNKAQIKDKSL